MKAFNQISATRALFNAFKQAFTATAVNTVATTTTVIGKVFTKDIVLTKEDREIERIEKLYDNLQAVNMNKHTEKEERTAEKVK